MDIAIDALLAMIGEREVVIQELRKQIAALQKALADAKAGGAPS